MEFPLHSRQENVPICTVIQNFVHASQDAQYVTGDGWSPVVESTPKGQHNESWALGLSWNSNCLSDKENVPECTMLFDAPFRASGGAQIKRVPAGGTVTFDKCSIFFDSTFLNSTSCFQVYHSLMCLPCS